MLDFIKKIKSPFKANKQPDKTHLRLTSKKKDILTSLFDLPIRQEWLSDTKCEKILNDSTVLASMNSRKAVTLKKELTVQCEDEHIKENLNEVFTYTTLDNILDTPYQGISVFEQNWDYKEGLFYPTLKERDYKNFTIEKDELMFSQDGLPQSIPKYKAVYTVYRTKPNKPYGQPLFKTLFWLVEFKNASLEFWVELLERFGTPWVVAKTTGDKDSLADEIYAMLGGDGAVIDEEDSLDIKTINNKGDFKEIIEYIDNQIRELILGGNLTGQVQSGSFAAANVHNDIREEIASADENIVNTVFKKVVKDFKELNQLKVDITIKLKDEDNPNIELAQRDKTIAEMGYTPTKEYIQNTYNIEVEDKKDVQEQSSNILNANKQILANNLPQDELEYQTNKLKSDFKLPKKIHKIIKKANSYEEALESLTKFYKDKNCDDIEKLLKVALSNADILARAQIEEENPNG